MDSSKGAKRVLIVSPTYEPYYVQNPQLEEFYTQNFDSLMGQQGQLVVKLAITDFASSRSFKAFLKNYARSRPGCYFIDGNPEASVHVAINIALRNFDYDYATFVASDNRTRGGQWLELLLKDFDDPRVQVVSPTVTHDGQEMCEQNQPGSIERESRVVGRSELFNLHCAVFSNRFLKHFGNRYPDVFECMGSETALMQQLAALGYVSKINFRVNLITDRLAGRTKQARALPDSRAFRNNLFEADFQKLMNRSTMINFLIGSDNLPLAKIITRHLATLKRWRWRYFYFHFFADRALDDFCKLEFPTKVANLTALFYRPQSEYQKYSYSIYSSGSSDFETPSIGLPALAAIRER